MNKRYFGTDGIRGTVNSGAMTPEVAMRIGMAAGRYFCRGDHRHRIVIGKDTRLSGYMLEPALVAGFVAVGMDVIQVGPMPTPAIAMLTKSFRADLGVMLTASHNQYEDNGVKLFGPDGYKLSDEAEYEIEQMMDNGLEDHLAPPTATGRAKRLEDVSGRYTEHVKNTLPSGFTLEGMKVVIDCANGAGYKAAPTVLTELGAEVLAFGISPNGKNINKKCGSTYPEYMCDLVRKHKADLGLALDGDADRVLIADDKGVLTDGDQLMGFVAAAWAKEGRLKGNTLVATEMSNMGLDKYLKKFKVDVIRTSVGDRYVVEALREKGLNLGGEQSGHIVFGDYSTTGDGIIAALQVMKLIKESGKKSSDVLHVFKPYPQILKSARYSCPSALENSEVKKRVRDMEEKLGKDSRLLIRKSGTEPVIRVMAEGEDRALLESVVRDICETVENVA